MIHKRRRLPRCPITQSSESMHQSVHGFLSHTSLQKVFKLILPSNHRHFLPNRRCIPIVLRQASGQIPNMWRTYVHLIEWSAFVFPSHERCYLIFNTSVFIEIKKNHFRVTVRISRFAVKFSCIQKMARDWKISSQEALRDYKSCERQHLITEDAIHRGTEGTPRPLWEAPPSSEGPRGCNHQQHDHDWRTTSRRETASWEESCWWVSLRGEKLRCMPDWKRHREHVRRNSVNMNC